MGLRPGEIIDGRLRIDSLIGYGGQGVVLKVTHLEWDRELALKLPLPEVVSSPKKHERFLQEAETWIRLGVHPHIVRCWFVHKVVGLPALFLDLISGGSLEDRMKSGDLAAGNWSGILTALLQVTEGLAHSHSMGVVHRDIKPENLLIRESGEVCVTDFGLVKSISSKEIEAQDESDGTSAINQDPGITGSAQFLGTPRYGAPEQWNKAMSIGPTTDVYALGVILYEMSCGRRPFDAPGEKVDVLELIQRHLHSTPRDPREFNPQIPPDLAGLALHCLQKDPSQRPQSMLHLLSLLNAALQGLGHAGYRRPTPVPGGDRADLLNNAAYSLYSLGRVEKARTLLQRGLMLEAGHPECLYNLVQIERREGRISPAESMRRLRRANARYPLALLCIEEGLGKNAMDLLDSFPEQEKNGLIYRTQGDAYMYAKQYLAAQRSYEKAQLTMPNDQPTRLRKVLAAQGLRGLEGHVYFPSSVSCYNNRAPNGDLELLLSHDSTMLVAANTQEVVCVLVETESLIAQAPRPAEAGPVLASWSAKHRLLLQDAGGFELWDLAELQLLQRTVGRVLAASPDLKKLILLREDGVLFLNKEANTAGHLQFPPDTRPSGTVKACFSADGSGMCVLTPMGQVGQVDAEFRVIPLAWPPAVEEFADVVVLQLSSDGVLYLAHRSGLFQAYNFSQQRITISFRLPFMPRRLELDRSGQTVVVSSETHYGVFLSNGELIYRGEGPFAVDTNRRYGLGWAKGSLTLFELSPFRRVRSWVESIAVPKSISIAQDGRCAVSLAANGDHHVWEVDEDNRVYEHSLLLTPGQSYADLISGFQRYQQFMTQASALFRDGDHFQAYNALRSARNVKGFFQAKEALDLHRELSTRLRRGGLETIWERLNLTQVSSVSIVTHPSRLAVGQDKHWSLHSYRGVKVEEIASGLSDSEILGVHCLPAGGEETLVAVVDRSGKLTLVRATDGVVLREQGMGIGPLTKVHFFQDSAYLVSAKAVTHLDLRQGQITSSLALVPEQMAELFPLSKERLVLKSGQGPVILSLKNGKLEGPLPVRISRDIGELTFATELPERKILLAGFSDGSCTISDHRSGKVHFGANKKSGPITGYALSLQMAVGVTVSASGKLAIFDLTNGELFERFTAHADSICQIQLTEDARYLVTRTIGGNCRLWELSWALTQLTSPLTLDWLATGAFDRLGMLFKPR